MESKGDELFYGSIGSNEEFVFYSKAVWIIWLFDLISVLKTLRDVSCFTPSLSVYDNFIAICILTFPWIPYTNAARGNYV